VLPATQIPDGRLEIEKSHRQLLRQIADPLQIGEMGLDKTHFLLGGHWKAHFTRKAETGTSMSVRQLRRWIDDPKRMGLPKEAQNLVILLFASQTNRSLYLHGGPFDEATIANIPDDCDLRTVDLPDPVIWETAVRRAGSIFGLAPSKLLSAKNVSGVASDVKKRAVESRRACQAYAERLKERLANFGRGARVADRQRTATASQALIDRLHAADSGKIVDLVAAAEVATSETAMGECLSKAAELEGNLDTGGWEIFEAVGKLTDDRQVAAQEILNDVRQALASDEHVVQLAPTLKAAQAKAVGLLTRSVEKAPTKPSIDVPPVQPPPKPGKRIVDQGTKHDLELTAAKDTLVDLGHKLKPDQAIRVNLSWVIEEGDFS
jgi:hypothetical protein